MATYSAIFTQLGGFYDGLGLLALTGVGTPSIVQAATGTTTHAVSGGQPPPLTITFGSAVTAGNALVVISCGHSDPGFFLPDAYSISDSLSNSYSLIQTQQDGIGGGNNQNRAYIASGISGGSNTISLGYTKSGSNVNTNLAVLVLEIAGVATSSTVADKTQTINAGSFSPVTLSVTAVPSLLLIAYECDAHQSASGNLTLVSGYAQYGTAASNTAASPPMCVKAYIKVVSQQSVVMFVVT